MGASCLEMRGYEGHRASEVIAGIRLMFQKDVHGRVRLGVNDIVLEVLTMARCADSTRIGLN
jgi:hypothetical protein